MTAFGGLTPEGLKVVSRYLTPSNHPANKILVKEGEIDDRLYLIQKGKMEILKKTDGHSRRLTILVAGSMFGEMSLIGIFPRSATVRTLTSCRTLTLRSSDLQKVYLEDKDTYIMIILNLAREVCRRLNKMNQLIVEFGTTFPRHHRG